MAVCVVHAKCQVVTQHELVVMMLGRIIMQPCIASTWAHQAEVHHLLWKTSLRGHLACSILPQHWHEVLASCGRRSMTNANPPQGNWWFWIVGWSQGACGWYPTAASGQVAAM